MFHVGQRVVCVDAEGAPHIKQDAIYTVADTCPECARLGTVGPQWLSINLHGEQHSNGMHCTEWAAERFRPIVERETDISFAHEILRKASKRKTVKTPEPFPSDVWNG